RRRQRESACNRCAEHGVRHPGTNEHEPFLPDRFFENRVPGPCLTLAYMAQRHGVFRDPVVNRTLGDLQCASPSRYFVTIKLAYGELHLPRPAGDNSTISSSPLQFVRMYKYDGLVNNNIAALAKASGRGRAGSTLGGR